MAYKHKDHYFLKAKKENYAARSIYKLEEMDTRHKLIRPKMRLLDLGAAPGSWSQYMANKVGPGGCIIAIDYAPLSIDSPQIIFLQKDIYDLVPEDYGHIPFDGVLSDMAPKTTGIRMTDQARSLSLCEMARDTAYQHLKPEGFFICKIFHGPGIDAFCKALKSSFATLKMIRPKSTRPGSFEIFIVAQGYKGAP